MAPAGCCLLLWQTSSPAEIVVGRNRFVCVRREEQERVRLNTKIHGPVEEIQKHLSWEIGILYVVSASIM